MKLIAVTIILGFGLGACTQYKPAQANCFDNMVSRSANFMSFAGPDNVTVSSRGPVHERCSFEPLDRAVQ